MKTFLIAVSFWLLAFSTNAQHSYGNQTIVDIPIGNNSFAHSAVYVPAPCATATAACPIIIFQPGRGEEGSTADSITVRLGPSHFIYNGQWNATALNHKTMHVDSFIVITMVPPVKNAPFDDIQTEHALDYIFPLYHPDINRLHLFAISFGGGSYYWYAARIHSANPCLSWVYFTPKYRPATCFLVAPANNYCDPYQWILNDSIYLHAYSDPRNDTQGHGQPILDIVNNINKVKPGYAVWDDTYPDGHSNFNHVPNPTYVSPTTGETVYEEMAEHSRNATITQPTQTLTTGVINGSPFCVTTTAGANVTVPYTTNTGGYNSGNVFYAELSDPFGGFSNPVIIDSLVSTVPNGFLSSVIPANTLPGTKYHIRTRSKNPAIIGTLNNSNITINKAANSIAPAAAQNISVGTNGFTLTVTDVGATAHTWKWGTSSGSITTLLNDTTSSYTPNSFMPGVYYLQCTSTFSCGNALSNVVQITVTAITTQHVRIYPTKLPDNSINVDGCNGFQYHAGDSIVIRAANNPYSFISLSCMDSVTLINEGGQVLTTCFNNCGIQGGIRLYNCTHVHVTGTGTPGITNGFYNTSSGNRGVGVQIWGRSAWIEVDHTEEYNKNAGFWIKEEQSDNNCDSAYGFPKWNLHDFKIHDNYIHNMSAEGMYLGSTAPDPFQFDPNNQHPTVFCKNGSVDSVTPMHLGNFDIYNNTIDSTMRPGIQLSDADSGRSKIHDNRVTRNGFEYSSTQGNNITTGTYTRADIYNNYTDSAFADNFRIGGAYTNIYNNTMLNAGKLNGHTNANAANINLNDPAQNNVEPGRTFPDSTTFIIGINTYGNKTSAYNITANNQHPTQWSHESKICSGTYSIPSGIPFSTTCDTNYVVHYDTAHVPYDTIKIKTIKTHYSVTRYADSAKVKLIWVWFIKGEATSRKDTLLKTIFSAPYLFDSVVTTHDTIPITKCCRDSFYTDTEFVNYNLGIFYLNPGGTVSFQHVMDTAHYVGVNWLRLNYTLSSGAPYNVGTANTNGFNVLLTLNNTKAGAAGYGTRADSLITAAAPKWITGDNEPAINDSNISAHLNDLSALITVAHNHGIKVTDGGFDKTGMLNYVKDLQARGKTDSANTIIGLYSLNMTSTSSLYYISKNDSLLNAYATMNLDAVAMHWGEPGVDTSLTTLSGYLPFVARFIAGKTGKKIIITETATLNHQCSLLNAMILQEIQVVQDGLIIYEDGTGADGKYIKLQDCFRAIVSALP